MALRPYISRVMFWRVSCCIVAKLFFFNQRLLNGIKILKVSFFLTIYEISKIQDGMYRTENTANIL